LRECFKQVKKSYKIDSTAHAALQGTFEEAVVLHYTDAAPTEDTGMPLQSQVRVVIARHCRAGDRIRVALPDLSIQDLAGQTLPETLSAESSCIEQPMHALPRAARYLQFLGALLGVLVAGGLILAAWLWWSAVREDSRSCARVGGDGGQRLAAPIGLALASLGLLLQGAFSFWFGMPQQGEKHLAAVAAAR
jgi:hypothetical protein